MLAVNGFAADGNMFVKKVKQRLEVRLSSPSPTFHRRLTLCTQWYRHAHAKDMPLRAIARLIQTMLYAQRFFPYYVYNILGGIEEDGALLPRLAYRLSGMPTRIDLLSAPVGTGAVYSFDPVGSYEREACRAAGAAQSLVQPFLDNQVRSPPRRCCYHHRAQSYTRLTTSH